MSGFKLIAIRPLKECNKRFSKVLKRGEIHKFYNNYNFRIHLVNNKEEVEVEYTPTVTSDLYNIQRLDNPLFVNISAVVGKNGTGKSTLIELFFFVIYLLSLEYKKINAPNNKRDISDLEIIKEGLKVEIYYSIENSIYCLKYDITNNIKIKLLKSDKLAEIRYFKLNEITDVKLDLDKFFYSIAINYSIHGLNSLQLGNWINKLFHKNDGYQTPVVINPMRDKGNFDINEENYFAKTRLFSNLLTLNNNDSELHHFITDSQKVTNFIFSLKREKVKFIIHKNPDDDKSIDVTFEKFYENNDMDFVLKTIYKELFELEIPNDKLYNYFSEVKYHEEVIKYILKKLVKISRTYINYKGYFELSVKTQEKNTGTKTNFFEHYYVFNSFEEYLRKLKNENTHITFKLNQAINYLKNNILRNESSKDLKWKKNNINREIFEISVKDLSNRINNITNTSSPIINNIPPSLFNIDICLEQINEKESVNNISNFKDLSSGEQQLIHSVQSVLYHLINVNSVFNQSENIDEDKRNTFNYVNIIFDEVELYFHPEYQRNFISFFLSSLNRIDISKISAVNVLFSTHSPFILSDIPICNILRLSKNGLQSFSNGGETFGANIHNLLANDFFLEDGFMGEFAKNKIKETVTFLNFKILEKKIHELDENNLKSDEENEKEYLNEKMIKLKEKVKDFDRLNHKNIINIIGEPIIKNKLQMMYEEIFEDEDKITAKEHILDLAKKAGLDIKFNN